MDEKIIKNKFKYLDDQEIIFSQSQDLIGTRIYTEILKNVIMDNSDNCYTETIALLGKWGIGKSSIIKSLENEFRATKNGLINNKGIKFFYYNAWKYNNDNFRKTFLVNSTESGKDRATIEKELYEISNETKYEVNGKYSWVIFSTILFLLILITLIKLNALPKDDYLSILIASIPSVVTSAILSWTYTTILKTIIIEKRVSVIKEFSPQDFSDRFQKIVEKKNYFSIYVIDDIDRCTNHQILEILETIHGFLKSHSKAVSNYVFIVPIDKVRIYNVLMNERQYSEKDCDEYFNKLFDIIINLDSTEKMNMFEMIKKLNDIHEFSIDSMSINLLADFLVSTPREIKRNVNELNLTRTILEEKINKKYINSNLLNGTDQLTKLFILKKKWPSVYEKILEQTRCGINANSALHNYLTNDEDNELVNFIRMSMSVTITDIRSFEYLKDTEININANDVAVISSCNIEELNSRLNNGTSIEYFIDLFVHVFRQYIDDRNLIKEYTLPLLKVYLWTFIKTNPEQEMYLTKKISVNVLISLIQRYLREIVNENKGDFDLSSFDISELIYIKKGNTNSSKIINEVMESFIKTKQFDQIYLILVADNKINFFTETSRRKFFDILVDCWKDSYDEKLGELVSDSKLFDHCLNNEKVKVFIEDDSRNLLEVIESRKPELLKTYYERIIENTKIKDILSKSIVKKDESYNSDIKTFTFLSKFNNESFLDHLDNVFISVNSAQYINSVNVLPHGDEKILIISELSKLFLKNMIFDYRNLKQIQLLIIRTFSINNYLEIITDLVYKSDLEFLFKFEYLFLLLAKSEFKKTIVDVFIKSMNECTNVDVLKEVIGVFKQLNNTNGTISYTALKMEFSFQIFTEHYFRNFLPHITLLDDDKFYEFVSFTNLERIINTTPISEYIKGLTKNVKLYSLLLDKITTIDDYIYLSKFINHNTHKSKFHKATENLLSRITNINDLIRLHDIESLTDTELKMIKKVKLEKFYSSSTVRFTKIVWNEDQIKE